MTAETATRATSVNAKVTKHPGYYADEEERLADEDKNWREIDAAEQAASQPRQHGLSIRDFLDKEFPAMTWRVADLIPGVGAGLIYGMYKAGKSLMALQVSMCVAAGLPFMGREIVKCPVLLVEEEGDPKHLQTRIQTQADALGVSHLIYQDALPLTVFHRERVRLDDPAMVDMLIERAKQTGAKLIIIGPLSQVAEIKDENAAPEVNRIMRTLNDIATAIGGTAILVHHRRKDGQDGPPKSVEAFAASLRGRSALMGAVDAAIGIHREYEDTNGVLYVLLRDGPARKEHFTFDGSQLLIHPSEAPDKRKAPEADVLQVLRDNPGSTKQDLIAKLGVTKNTVHDRLNQLVNAGQATFTTGDRGVKLYTAVEVTEPEPI